MAEKPKESLPKKRVRTPTVLQMEAVECGAAALATVLGYYGRIVSLEELRSACGVSRDGTKASNILKAARKYGLKAKGFSKQPESLPKLRLPMIVFWNFNHFVVVEGFSEDKVFLNDPAVGPRVVTREEFEAGFTGVVLVFEPGPEFQPGGERRNFRAAMRKRLKGSETGLAYVILTSFAASMIGLIVPIFAKVFIDYVLIEQFYGWVLPLLIGMAATGILSAFVAWLQRHYLLRLSTKMSVASSYHFMRHVLRLPIEFFTQRYGGEVGARMGINDQLAQLLSGELAVNVLNLLMVVLYASMMFYFDVLLTVIAIAIAAVNIAALQYVARRRKDISVRLMQEQGKMIGASMSGLQAVESLKAVGGESDFFSRWSGHLAKVMVARQKMAVFSQALGTVPALLSTVASISILGIGTLRVMDGEMTIGTLVAFQALMFGFMEPVNQLVSLASSIQQVEGQLNRLDDVLRYDIDPELADENQIVDDTAPPKLIGRLELKNITFGYSPLDPPLIRNFNLSVEPGSRVALVGASASGKSTLSKVISGLYPPWSGEIFLDGQTRKELPRSVITNSLAMVDQDFFFYEGTIREVLTMWDTTIPDEDIIQAAKDACIHNEIAVRAGGYDSKVEEGGRNFSGGQRQRLEIARALVAKPSILVLDEATSALDTVTEQQIDENLRRRGCTCVIIAHRLSTIRDCDEIIVLDRGRVVQRGTHESLSKRSGDYRNFIASQD